MTTSTVPAAACAGCGAALSAGALFCLSCGAPAPRDLREQRDTGPRRKAWFDIEPVPEPAPPPAPAPAPEQETAPLTFDDARPAAEPDVVEPEPEPEPEPAPELTEEQREVARLEAVKREAEIEYQLLKAKWAADEQERKRLAALQPAPVVPPAPPPVALAPEPLAPPEPLVPQAEPVVDESVVLDEPVVVDKHALVDEPVVVDEHPVVDGPPKPEAEPESDREPDPADVPEPAAPAADAGDVAPDQVAPEPPVRPEPVVAHEPPTLPGLETLPDAGHARPAVPAVALPPQPVATPAAVDPTRSGSDARGVADEFEERIERSPFFGERPSGRSKGRGRGRAADTSAGTGGSVAAAGTQESSAPGRSAVSTGSASLELDNPDDLIGATLPSSGRRWFRRPAPPREPVVSSFDAPPSARAPRRPVRVGDPAATPDVATPVVATPVVTTSDVPTPAPPTPVLPGEVAKPDPANLAPVPVDAVAPGSKRKARARGKGGSAAAATAPAPASADVDITPTYGVTRPAAPAAAAPVTAAPVTSAAVTSATAAPAAASSVSGTPVTVTTSDSSAAAPRNVLKADPGRAAAQSSLGSALDDPDADARHLARYSTARWLTAMVVVAGLLGAGVVLLLWTRGGDQLPPTNSQAQAQSLQLAAVRAWQQGNTAWASGDIATVCAAYDGVGVGGLWLDRVSCIASEQQGFDKSPPANRAQVGRMTFDPRLAEIVDGDAVVIWLSKATIDGQPVTLFRADDFAVMRVLPGQGWRQVGARYSGNVVGTVPRQLAASAAASGAQSGIGSPFPGSTPSPTVPAASPGLTQPTPAPTEPVPSGTSALFG